MSDVTLEAQVRTEFGKGAARRTRRAGLIPAVLYGHGADPLHVSLPGHATFMALKIANALFTIKLDGEEHLAIVKDAQIEPVRQEIEHVDLLIVRKGEKIVVDVAVQVIGESAPSTIHFLEQMSVQVEADATKLPEFVEIDITGLEAGTVLYARDIKLPEGSTLVTDPDADIVNIAVPQSQASAEEEAAAEAAEAITLTPAAEEA